MGPVNHPLPEEGGAQDQIAEIGGSASEQPPGKDVPLEDRSREQVISSHGGYRAPILQPPALEQDGEPVPPGPPSDPAQDSAAE